MLVSIKRIWLTPRSTVGELRIDGALFCYTLEDVVRPFGLPKVLGCTAIPPGTYRLVIDESPRFGRRMPHILNVPGFEGIRIHVGNTATDTEGCVLLGMDRGIDRVLRSREAFRLFMPRLEAAGTATVDVS